jgi:hypothetical protein
MGKALRNIAKVVSNITTPRNEIDGWYAPSSESCGRGPVRC